MSKQGDLDSSCGIYAVINSCSFASGSSEDVNRKVLHRLFNGKKFRLSEKTVRNLIDPEEGTEKNELAAALKKAVDCFNKYKVSFNLKKTMSLGFQVFYPYGSKTSQGNIAGIFTRVFETFNDKKTKAIIIGIHQHWTVIESATESEWRILDSGGLQRIRKNHWTANQNNVNGVSNEAWIVTYS